MMSLKCNWRRILPCFHISKDRLWRSGRIRSWWRPEASDGISRAGLGVGPAPGCGTGGEALYLVPGAGGRHDLVWFFQPPGSEDVQPAPGSQRHRPEGGSGAVIGHEPGRSAGGDYLGGCEGYLPCAGDRAQDGQAADPGSEGQDLYGRCAPRRVRCGDGPGGAGAARHGGRGQGGGGSADRPGVFPHRGDEGRAPGRDRRRHERGGRIKGFFKDSWRFRR